ncbi:MAG TPA: D-alanyl-D-alanine carboxypeptidase [Microbacteriaceae bacterium]|jgi:D-alanyl-D-alanine carboxypeptidase/D-alanyl-D-alanine-endopeptidase (penicillin-binding protein 4)|nr:D-alanyl-D-alanine carboxypeptidase [Microbacteriaceae bacterium]
MDDPDATELGATKAKTSPFAGILTAVRRHPQAWIIAVAAVGFVVVGSGAVALGASVASSASAAVAGPSASPTPTPTPTPTATARPVPANAAAARRLRTCSVQALTQDARLGTLEAQVLNAKTGEVLFDRNGGQPAATASVMKVLTAAAALQVLGASYRIPTTVVRGTEPGSVVLIGGGDVTLSRLPSGQASFYTNAPHIDDLANQVNAAWDVAANGPITKVIVDASLFGGPAWQPSWDEHEERVVQGSTAYVTALQVDGDRNDPRAVESPRSTDPVGRAADAFAAALTTATGNNVTTITQGTAPAGAKQLGQVLSQPVSALIDQAVSVSDNTIMETLARLVAIKTGAGNTFAAENQGVITALKPYGIDTTGIHIADGSGLSADNAVPPSYVDRLFVKVLNRDKGLGVVYDGLPIAGKSGTLGPGYSRFTGANSIARGAVLAKTGWINNGYTLAGVIKSKDGTALTFAVYALGKVSNSAKTAIDTLVTGFYKCGDNLSNN